jgi:hypothetical protein
VVKTKPIDALLAKHEEFFNGDSKNKKYLRDLSKETKESRYHHTNW